MTDNKNRQQLITPAILRRLAGERSYARGEDYFESDAVTDLVDTGSVIKAVVAGSDDYRVTLRVKNKQLDYDCDCPVGMDGECCKHVVAAGLAWLAQQSGAEVTHTGTGQDEWQTIRAYLGNLKADQLVAMLLEQAENNPVLRNELRMRAARGQAGGVDIKALKQLINNSLTVRGFVDYRGMRDFLQTADTVVAMLNGLWHDKQAAAMAELAEYALRQGFSSYERTDDSDGSFGMLLGEIADLYKKALPKAGIDPVVLGKRLFDLQMRDQWGFIDFQDYTRSLGKTGLAAFRQAAEAIWHKVPKRKQGDDRDYEDYAITSIMEGLARLAGDVDALIAIKSRDLGSSYRYLQIAEILQEAKRGNEALAWAERGRKAFPDRLDVRLDEFLIKQYHKRKRHDEALQLAWRHFSDRPSLEAYKRVLVGAKYTKATDAWRDKAMAWLHDAIKKQATEKPRSHFALRKDYNSPLIDIYLAEGDNDKALQAARESGCQDNLWLKIAVAREADHPQDAIEIYQKIAERYVDQTNNKAYESAIVLVKKVQKLMQQAKRSKEFKAYVEQLQTKFKVKRNFMKLLQRFAG